MGSTKRRYKVLYRISIAVAVAMVFWIGKVTPPEHGVWGAAIAFALLAVLSEFMPVRLRGDLGYVTISVPIHWAAMVLFGPFLAIMTAAVSVPVVSLLGWSAAIILDRCESRRWICRFRRMLTALAGPWEGHASYRFWWGLEIVAAHTALDVINVGFAAMAYSFVGGAVGTLHFFAVSSVSTLIWRMVLPFVAGLIVYFLVDEIRFVLMNIVEDEETFRRKDWYHWALRCKILIGESVRLTWGQYILLPPVTFLVIYLYAHLGLLSGLVALGPFLSLRLAVQKGVERQRVYLETIATLGTYMQHYHPYTRGHLKRVADMSERLARELHLPAESVTLMPYAGLLHDIGKVGVSEAILDKVGQLTDEEWAKIREHPVHGAEIIAHLEFLDKTVLWIKYHHKWANGAGYPDDGEKNSAIPVEAAIIAVADAFDAMTDDREMSVDWVCDSCGYAPEDGQRPEVCPKCGATKRRTYRQPLSVDQALDELRRGAGTQFAPEVVKAFLRMVDREGVRIGDMV